MNPILREVHTNNWITLVFLGLLLIIAVLKTRNSERLHRYAFSLFNKNFLDIEWNEKQSFYSVFTSLLFLFFTTVYSLTLYFLQDILIITPQKGFTVFLSIFGFVVGFFLIKRGLTFLLLQLFSIENETKEFLFSVRSYQYSISFVFLIVLIFYQFGFKNLFLFLSFILLFFLIKTFYLLVNNKNLILSELFYFILYLCAFEIAPIFILYKLTV